MGDRTGPQCDQQGQHHDTKRERGRNKRFGGGTDTSATALCSRFRPSPVRADHADVPPGSPVLLSLRQCIRIRSQEPLAEYELRDTFLMSNKRKGFDDENRDVFSSNP